MTLLGSLGYSKRKIQNQNKFRNIYDKTWKSIWQQIKSWEVNGLKFSVHEFFNNKGIVHQTSY